MDESIPFKIYKGWLPRLIAPQTNARDEQKAGTDHFQLHFKNSSALLRKMSQLSARGCQSGPVHKRAGRVGGWDGGRGVQDTQRDQHQPLQKVKASNERDLWLLKISVLESFF